MDRVVAISKQIKLYYFRLETNRFKLHKISGTTAAYDLYTALNRTQRTFHNMHKGEYTPAAYAARRCGSRGVTCAFLQHSNLELYARFGSELLKPFLRSLANQ